MFGNQSVRALSILLLASSVHGEEGAARPDIRESVVKIFATQHEPALLEPWTKLSPAEVTGTGVVIDGNRILTNAHVVVHARQVYVQPFQSADKYRADVVETATGPDLAVLELRDTTFFETHPPVPFAQQLPSVGDEVDVHGYPMGGETLSITKGVVSRIEFADYYVDWQGLIIQIDAAINAGNSGGPAVSGGTVIGLTFSTLEDAENIGYVVPLEEIRAFLDDINDGSYDGRPQLFDRTQTLENTALRARLQLDKKTTGVMVTVPGINAPDYPLRPWDVITAIGEYDIDNAGMVRINDDLRLRCRQRRGKAEGSGCGETPVLAPGGLAWCGPAEAAAGGRSVRPVGVSVPPLRVREPGGGAGDAVGAGRFCGAVAGAAGLP